MPLRTKADDESIGRQAMDGRLTLPDLPGFGVTFYFDGTVGETGLPNTNNALEGPFSDLKTKVRVYSGISKEHRKKLLDEYMRRYF